MPTQTIAAPALSRAHRRAMAKQREPRARRPVGLPTVIAAGIERQRREYQAAEIARPMRELFAMLATGEVIEIDGKAFMRMPELDSSLQQCGMEYVEIAPAIRGWLDCWERINPMLPATNMRYLAARLDEGKLLTPRLVDKALAEFEGMIALIPSLEPGVIKDALLRTQIAWEFERMRETS